MNLTEKLLVAHAMSSGAVIAVLAVAFGLVYRSLQIFHIALGAGFVVSAYMFYVAVSLFHLPVELGACLAIVVGCILGCGMEKGVYRAFYVKRSSAGIVMVASLGLYVVITNAVGLIFGNGPVSIRRELSPPLGLWGLEITVLQAWQLGLCLVTLLVCGIARMFSKVPNALWAMGENPELLEVLRHPILKYRAVVLGLSGGLSAIPACLIMYDTGLHPYSGMTYVFSAATAVFFAGAERLFGWIIVAFALSTLQSLVIWRFSARWGEVVLYVALVVVLLFRRDGIFASSKRAEES